MRLYFPNASRVKKAAKQLSDVLTIPLYLAQGALARGLGYRDWHQFEAFHSTGPRCPLDETLTPKEFIDRQVRLLLSFAEHSGAHDGDVQAAFATARLTGNRPPNLEEQIEIRLACWRATILPPVAKRKPGAIGVLKVGAMRKETVILRFFGQPTRVITHKSVALVADFEYVSPRVTPPLFLPMRLYMPYGYYTEPDGARVLFSRDYHPLWRLRDKHSPERVKPWARIEHREAIPLWTGSQTPWGSPNLAASLLEFLSNNNVRSLPMLADALPLLVHQGDDSSIGIADGAALLKANRASKPSPLAAE